MEKAFCSLNLSSMTFVGFMGDFAVWAITDAFTGEIMYLVDDNGGSEIIIIYSYLRYSSLGLSLNVV